MTGGGMQFNEGLAEWSWSALLAGAGSHLQRYEADFRTAELLKGDTLSFSFHVWASSGQPPPEEEAESFDAWLAEQEALFDGLVGAQQTISVSSVGFVGAAGASLKILLNGKDVSALDQFSESCRTCFPASAIAQVLVLARQPAEGRPAQLARWAHVDALLEVVRRFLPIRIRVEVDAHLATLKVRTPGRFALGWVDGVKGTASLELSEIGDDGAHQPINLNHFDPKSGIVSGSAAAPVLLPENISEVARQALRRQRQLRSRVQADIDDPTRVIPEGLDIDDHLDLSQYSSRVTGFERYTSKQRPLVYESSNIAWHLLPDAGAFLRIPLRNPDDNAATFASVATDEDGRKLLSELDQALEKNPQAPAPVTHDGKLIQPNEELRQLVARSVRLADDRIADEATSGEAIPRSTPLVAVIADLDASASPDRHGPSIDESTVPFDHLAKMLNPDVQLKAHQRRGIAWLWHHAMRGEPGVLLADDMGLGKTLQVSAFLALWFASKKEKSESCAPALVVAPTVLIENWQVECDRFFQPGIFDPVCVLHGDELRRLKRKDGLELASIQSARLVLTNYETIGAYQTSLLKVQFSLVVFDEAQALKNETTLRSRGAQGLKRQMAIGMTGTPVENKLSDLWAVFEALQQGPEKRAFGRRREFETEYEKTGDAGIARVRSRLRFPTAESIVLRREKAQALRELPAKQFHEIPVEMTPHQLELERVIVRETAKKGAFGVLDKLRKLYQHPALVTEQDRTRLNPVTALQESPKTAKLMALLKEIKAQNEKALVFTQWIAMQELLRVLCIRELGLRRVNIINGDPSKRVMAQEVIRDFSASPGFDVLILSPLAAGIGLTITAANHVIHYGRWWNPAKEDQATDRAHRIGQDKVVHVYYPLLHHPGQVDAGFDTKLHRLVEAKRTIARDFLTPAEDVVLEQELERALREGAQ